MKIEFINGEVIRQPPSTNQQLKVTGSIFLLLSLHTTRRDVGEVRLEKCLVVFPRNDYEPDVVFFGKAKAALFEPDTMKFPIPDLVVEVLSESTEQRDRGVKLLDYEAHGVAEYWIVNAEAGIVEQHLLVDGRYEVKTLRAEDVLVSQVVPGFATRVAGFFDAQANAKALRELLG